MKQADQDQLAQTTRDAFLAIPAKQRTPILKKAPIGSPVIRALIQEAHIPPSFQPARIAHWLTAEYQRKLEELVLSPEHKPWFQSLLRNFFVRVQRRLPRTHHPSASHPRRLVAGLVHLTASIPADASRGETDGAVCGILQGWMSARRVPRP